MTKHEELVALTACPFCDGDEVRIADTGVFWIICDECNCEGPVKDTKQEAIIAWNTRAQASASPPERKAVAYLVHDDPELGDYLTKSLQAAENSERGYTPLYTHPYSTEAANLRTAIKEACDLLAERIYGNPARSSGHNARLILERALTAGNADSMKRWRHKKRGTTYTEIGRGTLQVTAETVLADEDEVVIYRADDDGRLWVRSVVEFEDGRFEAIGKSSDGEAKSSTGLPTSSYPDINDAAHSEPGPSEAPSTIPADVLAMKEAFRTTLEKIKNTSSDFGKEPRKLSAAELVDKIGEVRKLADDSLAAISSIDVPGKTAGEERLTASAIKEALVNGDHYLGAIRQRLDRLYEENPNDPRLREHISDEVDWIDELKDALGGELDTGDDDWRNDPSADERWNAGLDYAMVRFCHILGVDPKDVTWDAATEELDGDVCAVIYNILRVKFGDEFDPTAPAPAAEQGVVSVEELAQQICDVDIRMSLIVAMPIARALLDKYSIRSAMMTEGE